MPLASSRITNTGTIPKTITPIGPKSPPPTLPISEIGRQSKTKATRYNVRPIDVLAVFKKYIRVRTASTPTRASRASVGPITVFNWPNRM